MNRPFCHQLHLWLAAGSLNWLMPVTFKFCTVAFWPYRSKCGTPAVFGLPFCAKVVMYSCSAMAIAGLGTPRIGLVPVTLAL